MLTKPLQLKQGHREGGQRGTMTPGPIGFRKAVGFSGPSRGAMSLRGAHRNDTEKAAYEALFFGDHLMFDRKNRLNFGEDFFFLRSYHNSDKTAAFSPSVLAFTKPEIRHI